MEGEAFDALQRSLLVYGVPLVEGVEHLYQAGDALEEAAGRVEDVPAFGGARGNVEREVCLPQVTFYEGAFQGGG